MPEDPRRTRLEPHPDQVGMGLFLFDATQVRAWSPPAKKSPDCSRHSVRREQSGLLNERPEQFQEKCIAVFRPELRQNK
ncbi:hypothetical protein [Mesorhizobium sp. LjNodule214]|uniref:hypothetical protein n=1 Tax=Mesorhizobium sp. LjNodule214 TaxID=3342252 RepID=UPI003ECE298A